MLEWLCLIGVEQRSSYPQPWLLLVAAITWDFKTNLLCGVGALGNPWPKGMVPAWAAAWLRDYDIGCWYEAYCNPAHWRVRNGNCKCTHVINLHRHSCGCPPRQPMMQSYCSIDLLEDVCTLCWQRSRLPNHTSGRCPSWSYDLIYDIVQVWADSYQWRNAIIPHLHEHDNHGDSWQSQPCVFIWKSGFCQREHMDVSWM
jgi:hypothetical protein